MKKVLLVLLITIVVVMLLLSQITSQTMAQASLAQSTANAVQASTNLAAQCLTGLMVVVALIAGVIIGTAVAMLKGQRRERPINLLRSASPDPSPYMQPQPGLPARLGVSRQAPVIYMISGTHDQPNFPLSVNPDMHTASIEADDESDSFQGWGF